MSIVREKKKKEEKKWKTQTFVSSIATSVINS